MPAASSSRDLDELLAEWDLSPDGETVRTAGATVLPVRTDSADAVLKVTNSPTTPT